MASDETKSAAVLNRFLRECALDRASGRELPLEEYQARYPGFEEQIAQEHARLCAESPPEHFPPPFGDGVLGPYRLKRELGRGGQGSVYLAHDTRLDREVAIKVLSAPATLSHEALQRFHREASLAARLEHPGICAVYESDAVAGVPYVVMRHVPGETLARRLHRARQTGAPPEVEWSLAFAESAARALHAAHEAGVIHRDVKPGNLMVTPEDQPVVLDFGLAREAEGTKLTRTGDVFGTPSYMSPEQIEGHAHVDGRADVYALAASLYELVTLEPPHRAPTREALYHKILTERPADPRRANAATAQDLGVVLQTALEKDPDRRYQSAQDFADDLQALRESRPIAARPVGPLARAARWAKREPLAASLLGSAVAALVLAAGLGGYLVASAPAVQAGELELERLRREALVTAAYGGRVHDQTRAAMVAVLADEPGHGSLRSALALYHENRGEHEAALAVLDAAPADTTEARLLERMRAAVFSGMGRADEAARIERELGAPREPYECWWVARSRLDADPETPQPAALELIERAIYSSALPRETFFVDAVRAALPLGERDVMLRAAETLERNHADSALSWFAIAMARSGTADRAGAVAALERSLEIDPDFPQALTMYAIVLAHAGELEPSLELFERALANTIGGPRERRALRLTYADELAKADRIDEALTELDRALEEEPEQVDALLQKGELLADLGLRDGAAQAFRTVLELDPGNLRAAAGLAR